MRYKLTKKIFFLSIYVTASLYHNMGFSDEKTNKILTQENKNGKIDRLHFTSQKEIKTVHFIRSNYSSNAFNDSYTEKKERCIAECLSTLPTGTLDGAPFHRCMNECMGMMSMCNI
ncbi:hypothetical protein FGI04_15205 [Dickeya ananatis]|uniref:hypothetical protein n=1 Tax=Dickeya ananatis TaxID=3061286 RepID=UPI001CE4D698|nr:hypothetical protein FGI04_15205 [Dickeya zeae]